MEKIQKINDVCKEVLTILAYFNEDLIEKIPSEVLKTLNELAADSNLNFYIDTKKALAKQDISEESKDLIAIIYYNFVSDENEKNEIYKSWNKNEYEYEEEIKKIYNSDSIFENKNPSIISNETVHNSLAVVEYKQSLFKKILCKFKNIFHFRKVKS